MKAAVFHKIGDIRVYNVDFPKIENEDDIILKVTSTAICGSDLHILDGFVPQMKNMTMRHEFMGIVEEVGKRITKIRKGDRVVVPFTIACGQCFFCTHNLHPHCEITNPEKYGPEGDMLKGKGGGLFGPDAAVDAVGAEAERSFMDKLKAVANFEKGTPKVMELCFEAVRRGGSVAVVGVYGSPYDNFPVHRLFDKGINVSFGQSYVHKDYAKLSALVTERKVVLNDIISHRLRLEDATHAYDIFKNKKDNCVKVVMKP